MMYAIIAFMETNFVDWVPMKWLTTVSGCDLEGIRTLISDRTTVTVYWPPSSTPGIVSRSRSRCVDRELNWEPYDCRIFGTASEY